MKEDKEKGTKESFPVILARRAVESYIKEEKRLDPPLDLPGYLKKRAGVFICLKLEEGNLRGCIGTVQPTTSSVAEEIIRNAIEAAVSDPRFFPVQPQELSHLIYSVDVLEEPQEVPDASYLNPKKYGVIVKARDRMGLLLPDLEGIDSREQQLALVRRKADITPDEPVKIFRFKVTRYE